MKIHSVLSTVLINVQWINVIYFPHSRYFQHNDLQMIIFNKIDSFLIGKIEGRLMPQVNIEETSKEVERYKEDITIN